MPKEYKRSGTTPQEWPSTRPEYMRPPLAAQYVGHSESTLAKLRMRANRAKGPTFLKVGQVILYRRSDLDAWLERNVVAP